MFLQNVGIHLLYIYHRLPQLRGPQNKPFILLCLRERTYRHCNAIHYFSTTSR